jgi:hypothetical protein
MRDVGSNLSEQKVRGVRLISHTDDVSRAALDIRNSRTTPAVSDFQILSPICQGLQHDDSTFPGADHGVHRTGGAPVLPTESGADGLTVSPKNAECDSSAVGRSRRNGRENVWVTAALILTGSPGSGKSSVLDTLSTLLEIDGTSFGAIESEQLACG